MKSNQRISGFLTLCSVAMLFLACVNQMEPAKNALDNIYVTLNSVATDAQKYVPDQFAQAQSKVAELTASYEKKDYTAVVVGAPAVLMQVKGLAIESAPFCQGLPGSISAVSMFDFSSHVSTADHWRRRQTQGRTSTPCSLQAPDGRGLELATRRRGRFLGTCRPAELPEAIRPIWAHLVPAASQEDVDAPVAIARILAREIPSGFDWSENRRAGQTIVYSRAAAQ
jgi:hypothetical protein